ncbi:uncharacterized protein Nmlp_2066 [Natronomonas moolapensis 8.8.11]|uniref:Uncharacterized protein n=1 Tax=Natronomonas moolapensis (strain DSM 18674 / CECT 7526 / JCM 14361 / 8.8.11) TaxID=268739 RepID=M1Y174_NATM8|nr:hypothetical protein [Natronomonas moolapensis]CCQ36249.1 uncharacterized protein Nmlp_2066 [Natronomonas moolapensis 8.8.11]
MVPPTRRRLLRTAAAATAVGLAGCNGSVGERSGTSRSVSENADSTIPGGTTEHDPEMLLVRAGTDELPVRIDGDGGTPESHDPQPSRLSYAVIDTRSRAERLVAADGVDVDAVTAFGSATAFDSEALYLETRRVEECFRLRLCGISWTTEQIRTAYARELRPYDERCSAGESVFESRLIRLPAALDRAAVSSYGSSTDGQGRCHGDGDGDGRRERENGRRGSEIGGPGSDTPAPTPAATRQGASE